MRHFSQILTILEHKVITQDEFKLPKFKQFICWLFRIAPLTGFSFRIKILVSQEQSKFTRPNDAYTTIDGKHYVVIHKSNVEEGNVWLYLKSFGYYPDKGIMSEMAMFSTAYFPEDFYKT